MHDFVLICQNDMVRFIQNARQGMRDIVYLINHRGVYNVIPAQEAVSQYVIPAKSHDLL